MFENPGGKLKGLALVNFAVIFVMGIIGGAILGKVNPAIMIMIWIASVFVAWVGSIVLYGFGELVETNAIIAGRSNNKEESKRIDDTIIQKDAEMAGFKRNGTHSTIKSCAYCKETKMTNNYWYTDETGTHYVDVCDDCIRKNAIK